MDPGSCYVDMFARWRFPSDLCEDPQMNPIETDLEAGTYAFAVANTLAYSDCTAKNNYIVTISTLPCIKGDLNFSGATDADDIGPFVDVLLADWPDMAIFCRADMNDDWSVDGQDIQPFIDCVLNPGMCP